MRPPAHLPVSRWRRKYSWASGTERTARAAQLRAASLLPRSLHPGDSVPVGLIGAAGETRKCPEGIFPSLPPVALDPAARWRGWKPRVYFEALDRPTEN